MYQVKYVYTRPSVDIIHYEFPQEFLEYVWENYSDSRIYNEKEISEDGLSLTQITFWTSKEAFDKYQADPIIQGYLDKKRTYSQENGLSVVITYTEE
jgi:hypothetical protein